MWGAGGILTSQTIPLRRIPEPAAGNVLLIGGWQFGYSKSRPPRGATTRYTGSQTYASMMENIAERTSFFSQPWLVLAIPLQCTVWCA
ncbi:hypothetical protein VN97_g10018 [Penicillium thymicola]|uniref:Uncharacterized protein n=1 Tax=Penicillium thymicola TaxID=293382 RepID=A0AAI9TA52_PENTH|nr:hypothetical protein VN97_g10018 [Penicillium thymicola]